MTRTPLTLSKIPDILLTAGFPDIAIQVVTLNNSNSCRRLRNVVLMDKYNETYTAKLQLTFDNHTSADNKIHFIKQKNHY